MTADTVQPAAWLATWWATYGPVITLVGLAATVAVLLVSIIWATWKGKVDGWLTVVAWIAGFGFSAESMWVVATTKAHIPVVVAAGVFFVGEAMMAVSMRRAKRYRATRIAAHKPPTTGKHGRAVWIIALAMAAVVAFAATNITEQLLRAFIPLGVALLWWNSLTADDAADQPASRWTCTPTRLAERLGLLEPADDDRDLSKAARERRTSAMVRAYDLCRTRAVTAGMPLVGARARYRRLARLADEEMEVEVLARAARVDRLMAGLTRAVTAPVTSPAPAAVMTGRHDGADGVTGHVTSTVTLTGPSPVTDGALPGSTAGAAAAVTAQTGAGPVSAATIRRLPSVAPDKVDAVRRHMAANPGMTQPEIAVALGYTLTTVQRAARVIRAQDDRDSGAGRVNGHQHGQQHGHQHMASVAT